MRILVGGLLIGVLILCLLFLLEPPREAVIVATPTARATATVAVDPICTDEGSGWWYCG